MMELKHRLTGTPAALLFYSCVCIALFVYSGAIKLIEHQDFIVRVGQSPMLAPYAAFVGWFIPVLELVIALALIVGIFVPRVLLPAFAAFFGLMVLFCCYILAIFILSPTVPCACGGVIGEIGGWWGHLVFNLIFVGFSYRGVQISRWYSPLSALVGRRFWQAGVALPLVIILLLGLRVKPVPNHRFRGFERNFVVTQVAEPTRVIDVKHTGYYIAGTEGRTIYLAHPRLVDQVLTVDTRTGDTARIRINLPSIDYHNLRLKVNPPTFYLLDGLRQKTYRGVIGSWDATKYLDSTWYISALPMENGELVLFTMLNRENVLAKYRRDKRGTDFYPGLLTQQRDDGIFSTDGKLLYDPEEQRVLFLYKYRNEYLVMDTALHTVAIGNTVDTISQSKLMVGKLKSETYILQDKLPVNLNAAVRGNRLYVRSNILSENETPSTFKSNTTIDVYDYATVTYLHSFYLPDHNMEKVRDFTIIDHLNLAALQGKRLLVFSLPVQDDGSLANRTIAQLNRKKEAEHLSKKK